MTLAEALALLELTSPYTGAELKTAYRQALKVWHPDRFGDDVMRSKANAKTRLINDAFEYLKQALGQSDSYPPPKSDPPYTRPASSPPPSSTAEQTSRTPEPPRREPVPARKSPPPTQKATAYAVANPDKKHARKLHLAIAVVVGGLLLFIASTDRESQSKAPARTSQTDFDDLLTDTLPPQKPSNQSIQPKVNSAGRKFTPLLADAWLTPTEKVMLFEDGTWRSDHPIYGKSDGVTYFANLIREDCARSLRGEPLEGRVVTLEKNGTWKYTQP